MYPLIYARCLTKSVPTPYQVRTCSVSTPNKGTFIRTRYGVGTEQTRFRYVL